jgi:thioredoxin reductase (NADPH)
MPPSWSAARTQLGKRRSPSPRMDDRSTWWFADSLERSMARYLRDRIDRDPKIEVLFGHQVRELSGEGHLERVTVRDECKGEPRTFGAGRHGRADRRRTAHRVALWPDSLDYEGFVLTGPAFSLSSRYPDRWDKLGRGPFLVETSRPGVFAVGDIRSGSIKMVAPAVGEGGMAVRFVAEHLARSPSPAAASKPTMPANGINESLSRYSIRKRSNDFRTF